MKKKTKVKAKAKTKKQEEPLRYENFLLAHKLLESTLMFAFDNYGAREASIAFQVLIDDVFKKENNESNN